VTLQAPFPWFGGKSRAASLIWQRFGDVANYVEPFAGSLAVMLNRPHEAHTETVNDKDKYLANFWRSVQYAPDEVAKFADWPVNEADLHARHRWLVTSDEAAAFRAKMSLDPDYFDAKIAGWWVWGLCAWIGDGWAYELTAQLPALSNAGRGVHRKLPALSNAGQGESVHAWIKKLSDRLRRVRVACGDWTRVVTPSVTTNIGQTAILLDPPYSDPNQDMSYAVGDRTIAHAVREWAIANGDNPQLRIALCGYEGEHILPHTWAKVEWKANGGYSNRSSKGKDNPHRERIWFSPHCIAVDAPKQLRLIA
jgi:DNA adenine methylase